MARKLGELFLDVNTRLKKLESQLKKQEAAVKKSTAKQGGILKKLKASWLAVAGGAFLLFRGISKGIKTVVEFEQAIANVQSVSGGTKKELAALAREAGKNTVFSAKQAADALYFLASAGLEVKDMSKVLEPALNLAAAAQMDIARATDIVVNNLKVFGLEMDQATRVTDVMAKTVSSSNTNMEQLADALGFVGPIAKSAGIEFEDLNATLATMANRGLKGSQAGTQLRMALARLIKPPKEAKDALASYGITIDEINKLLPTPIKLFERLNKANLSNADALKILGVRQTGVFALIKDGIPDLNKMQKAIEDNDGAAKAMAETQIKTVSGALKLLQSKWQELTITLLSGNLPALQKIILGIGDMIEAFTTFIKGGEDVVDVTKDLIIIQEEYTDVVARLAEKEGELTKEEENVLNIRKKVLELEMLEKMEELNKLYEEQSIKVQVMKRSDEERQKSLKTLEEKLAKVSEETVVLTRVEANLLGITSDTHAELEFFGRATVDTEYALRRFTQAQINATQSSVELDEETLKLNQAIEIQAKALAENRISEETLLGLQPELIEKIKERASVIEEEIATREKADRVKQKTHKNDMDREDERKEKKIMTEEELLEKEREAQMERLQLAIDYYTVVDDERNTHLFKEEMKYRKETELMKRAHNTGLISTKQYNMQVEKLKTNHEKIMKDIKDKSYDEDVKRQMMARQMFGETWRNLTTTQQEEIKKMKSNMLDMFNSMTNYASQFTNSMQSFSNARLQTAINEYNAIDEADTDARYKKRKEIRELAEQNKAIKTAGAIIDTAASVAKTLASVPYPYNIPLGIAAAAAGAAQVALIRSEPIPSFARGTDFAPGGLSIVGEEGAELVELPRGTKVRSTEMSTNFMDKFLNSLSGITTAVNMAMQQTPAEGAGDKIYQIENITITDPVGSIEDITDLTEEEIAEKQTNSRGLRR